MPYVWVYVKMDWIVSIIMFAKNKVRHNEKKKPDEDGFYKDKPQPRKIIDPVNDFTNQRKKKV